MGAVGPPNRCRWRGGLLVEQGCRLLGLVLLPLPVMVPRVRGWMIVVRGGGYDDGAGGG
jgi:hypothetical protein